MIDLFSERAFSAVVTQLGVLGYRNELLEESYRFPDYFAQKRERVAEAVAFGQTPVSYDTALIGVVCANGLRGDTLIDQFRSLGAPFILEVDKNEIREWAVSRKAGQHELVSNVPAENIKQLFVERAKEWKPAELLRTKNLGIFHWTRQPGLFAGLIPELEERIQRSLEPLLHDALSRTKEVYEQETGREPKESQLFRLIFWILTAKVFHDRQVSRFKTLKVGDADDIIEAVARQYKEPISGLLTKRARTAAVESIWSDLDFRNLSVEVLSQMWSTMLIDDATKQKLGIQRTSSNIVRYVIDRLMPFEQTGDEARIIFEPCTGSAGFLIGAMNALRPNLFLMEPKVRHQYFIKHLAGIETDPFGVEISKLALTLADFPNLGGWQIEQGDVFEEGVLTPNLRRAGVVLCNPPFARFNNEERERYQIKAPAKPVDLLKRVLDNLHPSGHLGFVLPRNIVDGNGYKDIRRRLAERFESIDLTVLPDKAFDADVEVGLLVAKEPIPHNTSRIVFSKVNDSDAAAWRAFALAHEVSYTQETRITPDEASETFGIPALTDVWKALSRNKKLVQFAEIHRGLEWNAQIKKGGQETGNRSWLVQNEPQEGYVRGVAPNTKFNVFEVPEMRYLNSERKFQRRNAWQYDWNKPKAIVGKAPRSRGPWRMAAFADVEGVACAQSFYGIWPTSQYDESVLAAILNSPIANAFIATREGKFNVTKEVLKRIPMPALDETQINQIHDLLTKYLDAVKPFFSRISNAGDPDRILKEIDAVILDGYKLPARLEHEVLTFFEGHSADRRTSHEFTDYIPVGYESIFSLSTHLSQKFRNATVGNLRERLGLK